jgi:formylglycine-generating enzyme required for sulfatase activity
VGDSAIDVSERPPGQSAPLNMILIPGGTFRMGSDRHYP